MADKENLEIESGIEEEFDKDVISNTPFDPNDININIVPRTIGQIVEMLEFNEILVPKFQRLPNLWDIKKKSRFIESLMLNLPIPLFYFDEGNDKKWRVIDGLQRISTLEQFILGDKIDKEKSISRTENPFRLVNLEFRTEHNGKCWEELPREVQRRIKTSQITINLIGKGTPEVVKYNIFSRINQGAIELYPQEIRTALFQGGKIKFIEDLVSKTTEEGRAFLEATDNSVTISRQENLDFATRFIAFYLVGHINYEPDMDTFLTRGMGEIPDHEIEQKCIKDSFKNSMKLSFEIFEYDAFRKPNTSNRRNKINKSLFEVISVGFAQLNEEEREQIRKQKASFKEKFIELNNQEKFTSSISTATALKERVKQRHEDFESLIKIFLR